MVGLRALDEERARAMEDWREGVVEEWWRGGGAVAPCFVPWNDMRCGSKVDEGLALCDNHVRANEARAEPWLLPHSQHRQTVSTSRVLAGR